MIIEKVDDGKEFPRCPDCGAVLYQESEDFTNRQKAAQKKQSVCDHEFPPFTLDGVDHRECVKCGLRLGSFMVPTARLMRCPKCAELYHVEGD